MDVNTNFLANQFLVVENRILVLLTFIEMLNLVKYGFFGGHI